MKIRDRIKSLCRKKRVSQDANVAAFLLIFGVALAVTAATDKPTQNLSTGLEAY